MNPLLLQYLKACPDAAAKLLVGLGVPALTQRGVNAAQIAPFLLGVSDVLGGKVPSSPDKYVNLSAQGGADSLRWLLQSFGLSDAASQGAVDAALAGVLVKAAALV